MAEKAGIPRHVFLESINQSVLGSMYTRYKTPALVNLDFTTTFTPKLLLKDMELGMGAAKAQGVAMPTASATRESIQALANNHPGDIDFSVLLLELARAAGMKLEPENVKVSDGLWLTMARLLLKSGIVVTQDAKLGVLPTGDVLVENDRIAAIAPALSAPDAETVDCRGHFVLPGLINAHMHTWQTALRSVAADWTLLEYFRHVHAGLATVFVPHDIHIATLAGALNQLDHGVTTLVDWAHNNPTPEHTDAGIAALKESGIRAAFFHGSPKPDPKPGQPHFSEVPHPRGRVPGTDRSCETETSTKEVQPAAGPVGMLR